MRELKTESDCRLVYAEIVRGYSCDPSGNLFLKHINEADNALTESKRRQALEEAKNKGLLSEREKLSLLAINGHWTKDEEKAYQTHLEEVESLRISLKRLVIPQQIAHMEQMIRDKVKEGEERKNVRQQLLGLTREEVAERKAAEFHILSSFYCDEHLTKPRFKKDDIDNLEAEDQVIFMNIYQQSHEGFTEKNIKRIAVCPFFLNAYMSCADNAYFFYGKPVASLSLYQLSLFSRGGYYKDILEQSSQRPPEEYYDDLDSVIQFYDRQYSIILGKRTNNQLMK